ncbi:hydrogenase maturation nickel metallochaperone HypA (plasmid) [Cupriavidus necator H16]|uniref:Hydrogenase maturation factor HypA n=1 Tax=Cupriavidus necator (strain ATCC 17699 / DSM 428 / KCTC 22496 / NCIMB 10442 / H16 / Stanier 337) TaxID=381666 RepID=Q7WXP1_CUPNH|nr:hydrogenase maturation nickel metallochaperone HypA [Cupriavidus necator]AAP85830.1 HypA3 [Cupriavidus necator H16]QCC05645.1 hydrogenase maturation nickel metallochaperone HypA [Cupriavidus necator H16]QQB81602.1 hydrogenase maturation nickel metallochaperone HypA [Cupriavidus necator]
MHELSIANSVVEICAEQARGARVLWVQLEIGRLCAVMPDAIRFCFDVCAKDTAVEGAELEIVETPGVARCLACGAELEIAVPFGQCACGSENLELISGQQLKIRRMEVA